VNLVAAGWIDTDRTIGNPASEKLRQATSRNTPLGRWASAEEVANVVHFLASPDASWITGQILVADGGLTLI
jgi:NAD(P)-dependent dehydrogenase (short-subunit alcohol dehydrogenase family)